MLKSAHPLRRFDPVHIGYLLIAAIAALRLLVLWASDADLFFDESQYWLWGQNFDFGYYSKPPLIGWVIRAVTDLAGSDSAFWVRAAAPLFHAAAALLLMAVARRMWRAEVGLTVALTYLSLPMIAVGSVLISTDTILLPFWCAALLLWLRQMEVPRLRDAALMGLCLGLGMMAKYAAAYFLIGAGLALVALPHTRLPWRNGAVALVVSMAVIAPNVIWNMAHDFATLSHTADNVDWVRQDHGPALNFGKLAEFLASQAMVMGPLLFGGFLWAAYHGLRFGPAAARWLLCMSLPVLLLVCVQALLSKAYANWAAMTYPAAVLLVVPFLLLRARRLLWAAIGVNLCLSLAIALGAAQVTHWMRGDQLLLKRYTGRAEMVQSAAAIARAEGLEAIISDNRHVLADVFYYGRDLGLALYAVPHRGAQPHYYAEQFALPAEGAPAELLYLGQGAPCADAQLLGALDTAPGAYAGRGLGAYRAPASCWEGRP
ncbi:glycosyltransferase family 39 protein [Phaeobacter sp. HF9A]|uniref:ArnT family glycosyltransferase n=1 Tax=Phaeobacter sp. HF9A TaxID=2721561 RepID=UPI001430C389|nr:glycosyltransferase family 39 protein [Phaeobacter sp. HF9A]NIZ13432.1 glycosyl transferase [Phaeobacter sp. HF9A]